MDQSPTLVTPEILRELQVVVHDLRSKQYPAFMPYRFPNVDIEIDLVPVYQFPLRPPLRSKASARPEPSTQQPSCPEAYARPKGSFLLQYLRAAPPSGLVEQLENAVEALSRLETELEMQATPETPAPRTPPLRTHEDREGRQQGGYMERSRRLSVIEECPRAGGKQETRGLGSPLELEVIAR
ncbi:hypothetical protein P7C73_g6305, partial [Tremellales sp. Uapishka_1]